jgi:hypothetical protein
MIPKAKGALLRFIAFFPLALKRAGRQKPRLVQKEQKK